MAKPNPAYLIRLGRAYVRLIGAAHVLLEAKLDLPAARAFAKRMLREIAEDSVTAATAETPAPTASAVSWRPADLAGTV